MLSPSSSESDPVRTSEPYNTEPIACGRMMVEKLEYVMGVVRKRA